MRPDGWLCALLAAGTLACSTPEVAIVGECHVTVPDVTVQLPTPESGTLYNIGVLGTDLLVQWNVLAPMAPVDLASDVHLAWVDSSGNPIGAPQSAWQSSGPYVSRWVREGDHLASGMILSRFDGSYAPDVMNAWAVHSTPTSSRRLRSPVAVAPAPDCPSCPTMDLSVGALSARFPAAIVSRAARYVLAGATIDCSTTRAQEWRLIAFDEMNARTLQYPDDPCADHRLVGTDYFPLAPELISLPLTIGVLFTAGSPANPEPYGYHGEYLFTTVDPSTLEPVTPMRTVAPASSDGSTDEQPRAAIAGDRIVFITPVGLYPCFRLHTMKFDGTDSHDAAWQPACNHDASIRDTNAELLTLDGAALIVWEHASRADTVTTATLAQTVQEVDAMLLTSLGQRGSEIVRVTPPDAWSFSGSPSMLAAAGETGESADGFSPRAALDGDRIVASWVDNRDADAVLAFRERVHFAELACTLAGR